MARNRSRGTLVDYLVAAIEPALIMVMVGSLMFFLLDTWYQGEAVDRLRWILFWFVFGIVLITRISMQIGGELARGYGAALGGAVALVGTVLSGFQPVLLLVMGFVWWATHKLTFDCTLIDEDQDAGVGLLQQSGLDTAAILDDKDETGPDFEPDPDPDSMSSTLMPDRPSWKFWAREPDEARRPHAPGVWLIYFTVGSLPVYALGQWLAPGVAEDRLGWTFIYFLAYIGSGMGLLLATSFLNLRRYLRRRKLRMPAAMTATWLTTGALMIAGLTAVAALLPIPLASVRQGNSARGASGLHASKYAVLKDSGAQGEGAQSEGKAAAKSDGSEKSPGQARGSGRQNDAGAKQQVHGDGREGGAGGKGEAKSGQAQGKTGAAKGGREGKSGAKSDRSNQGGKGQETSSEAKDQNAGKGSSAEPKPTGSEPGSSTPPARMPSLPNLPIPPLGFLQVPIMIVGILIVIVGVIWYWRDLVAVLRAILASILGGFGFGWTRRRKEDEQADKMEPEAPPRPFSSYANPFDIGMDRQVSPEDLVIYSFEALEAWSYENALARSPNETPVEFAGRIVEARVAIGPDAARLAGYFTAIVYGRQSFGPDILPPLRRFWRALEGRTVEATP